jgi:hypothetical protein
LEQSSQDSEISESELLSDRVMFKLFAAKRHLDKLKEIYSIYGSIMGTGRLDAEMEIDCYFAQIIGAKDSLLVQISEKLGLAIPLREICIDSVYDNLKTIKKEHLLVDLKMASKKGSWFWLLNELRNHSIHRAMISKRVKTQIHEDVNTDTSRSDKPEIYFLVNPLDNYKSPMSKQVIPYLEESIQQMKDLIEDLRNKESLLKQ